MEKLLVPPVTLNLADELDRKVVAYVEQLLKGERNVNVPDRPMVLKAIWDTTAGLVSRDVMFILEEAINHAEEELRKFTK